MSIRLTWFLKYLIRFLVKTTRFYVISWCTVWENAECCEIWFILNTSWNIKIATWMDAYELCISGVLEEHGVPTPPKPTPTPVSQLSRVGRGVACLPVCLCQCVEQLTWRGAQAPLCLPAADPCWETRHPLQEVRCSASSSLKAS